MSRGILVLVVVVGLVLSFTVGVSASSAQTPAQKTAPKSQFERMDSDGDGKISKSEFEKYQASLEAARKAAPPASPVKAVRPAVKPAGRAPAGKAVRPSARQIPAQPGLTKHVAGQRATPAGLRPKAVANARKNLAAKPGNQAAMKAGKRPATMARQRPPVMAPKANKANVRQRARGARRGGQAAMRPGQGQLRKRAFGPGPASRQNMRRSGMGRGMSLQGRPAMRGPMARRQRGQRQLGAQSMRRAMPRNRWSPSYNRPVTPRANQRRMSFGRRMRNQPGRAAARGYRAANARPLRNQRMGAARQRTGRRMDAPKSQGWAKPAPARGRAGAFKKPQNEKSPKGKMPRKGARVPAPKKDKKTR